MHFNSYLSGAFGTGSSGTSWNNRFKVLHLVLNAEYNRHVLLFFLLQLTVIFLYGFSSFDSIITICNI